MARSIILSILTFVTLTSTAQVKMRSLDELIDKQDAGWVLVKEWVSSAKNRVEILPVNAAQADSALYRIQVTTRSPMGAIVYRSGGLLIDNGWIRILGSGCSMLNRTLPDWNRGKSSAGDDQAPRYLLIADDVIGGFFLLNGGGLGKDLGKVYYFSPDKLEYEPLGLTYSDFLLFCFNNDLDKFYEGYRWENWKLEVATLTGDKVFNFFPPLWTKEGKDLKKSSRKAIPIEEQYSLNLEFRKQLGLGN